jgi:uncharacterized membrane protein YgaE (UPF0421/DUF939 family)
MQPAGGRDWTLALIILGVALILAAPLALLAAWQPVAGAAAIALAITAATMIRPD